MLPDRATEPRSLPMRRSIPVSLSLLLSWFAVSEAGAQSYVDLGFDDLPPPADSKPRDQPPKMVFSLLAEIPLPGPLPGDGPRLRGDLVEIGVAGGTIVTQPLPDATPQLIDSASGSDPDPPPVGWVTDETECMRFRSVPGGVLEAQKSCRRCKTGWKRSWRLRVPGNTLVPPLVADRRVYIGALDNRVYSLKARNGHRVWTVDIGGRISTPLMLWRGEIPEPTAKDPLATRELTLILAVPASGSQMVALESQGGRRVASMRLPEGSGKLVSGPLTTPDGKVVVARQQYAETEASLLVYRLLPLRARPEGTDLPATPPADEPDAPPEISRVTP